MATTPFFKGTATTAIYTPLLSGLTFDLAVPMELASLDLITTAPSFTAGVIPNIPAPTLASLTVGDDTLIGDGAFDVIRRAGDKHLESQYKKNRLSGAEWGKIYIQGIELALTQAAQFLVASASAAWAGETAKRQAADRRLCFPRHPGCDEDQDRRHVSRHPGEGSTAASDRRTG